MADLAGIALSGLRASKASLSTTSHNIVNIDTEGYSRQKTGLEVANPQQLGGSFVGQGVDVQSIYRVSNEYVVDQLRRDVSTYNSFDSYYEYASRIDQLLGDDSTAISPSLQDFFDSLQDLSSDPSSIPNRQVLLSNGEALANRFNTVYEQVNQVNETLNIELREVTAKATQLSENIASFNQSISAVYTGNTAELPNDLLDQRDEAVKQLSELIGVQVLPQENLSVSVFLGSGQPLVVGNDAFSLDAKSTLSGSNRNEIILTRDSYSQDISGLISGGRVGGLLSVRQDLVDPVFNELGRISMVLTDTVNSQHQLGMDLENQLGGLFFEDFNIATSELARIDAASENVGSAALSVTIDDTSLLSVDDYRLRFNGSTGNYTLFNPDNTVNATFADPGAGGVYTAAAEGFTINFLSGTPVDGDEFSVFPTRYGASQLKMELNDVKQIAAALPVSTDLPPSNTGSGYVEEVVVTDTTTADFTTTAFALDPQYRVEFTSGTTYDVINNATNAVVAPGVAFTPGQSNSLLQQAGITTSGYDVVYNGSPNVNDVVNISYNNGGVSDNRNALLLGALSLEPTIDGGTVSYQGAYSQLVSGVGTRTNEASVSQEAAQTILNQSQNQWESISGVNLDEEAANLIRFQQSYQASARVIQVSSELFDSILSSL